MTVVALLAEPPREGHVLESLVEADVLAATEAADLYGAMVCDAAVAVARSGGDLLVNYPPPEDYDADVDPESALRDLLDGVLDDLSDVRFEVQVGSTESARVGNTVTHLLESEGADSAAVLWPTAPFVDRTVIDGAAMKLRREEVVLGPAPDGRLYYAGFTEPVDFEDALAEPAVETLTNRAHDAGHGVAFENFQPLLERPADLHTVEPLVAAYDAVDRPVAPAATALFRDRGRLAPERAGD